MFGVFLFQNIQFQFITIIYATKNTYLYLYNTNQTAMKQNYFLKALLLINTVIYAQNFSWLQTPNINLPGNPSLTSYPSASDNQGNTFVCGYKDTPFSYNRVQSNLVLMKYNSSGTLLFSKTLTGDLHAHKLQTDNDGNVYVALDFLTNLSIDNFNLASELFVENPLLIKFSSNGDFLWHKTLAGEFTNHFAALAIDHNQNLYIGYDDYSSSHVEKIDKNTGETLQTIEQNGVKIISSISVDNESNIYVAGSCAEINAEYNGTPFPAIHQYNTYITKYNPAGQMQWTKYVEDITCPNPIVKARTPDEVYFSSDLFGNFTFDAITAEGPMNGYTDFFLARLNNSGNFVWVKEVPGMGSANPGLSNYLDFDSDGNIYFGGSTRHVIQWNETVSTNVSTMNEDILILKYNPSGDILWAKTAGGNSFDMLHGITILPDESLVVTGIAHGNTTFEPLSHSASSQYYPFVARLSQSALALPENNLQPIVVYPNPVKNMLTIQSNVQNGVATLYNMLGQTIQNFAVSSNETTIDVSELALGTYVLKLNSSVVKVIKE